MKKKAAFAVNTLSNILFNILTQLIGFFIIPLFVTTLGKELYGIWILSRTIMGYFQLLDLGVSGGIVKFVSESEAVGDQKNTGAFINTAIVFYTLVGTVVCGLVFLFAQDIVSLFNISPENHVTAVHLLRISGVIALVSWPNMALTSAMEGLMKYIPKNIFLGLHSLLNSVLVLVFVHLGYSLEVIVIVSSCTNLIPWIGNYIIVKRTVQSWRISLDGVTTARVKEIFSFSFWVLVQQLIVLAVYQTDQVIIGLLLPVAAVTVYVVVTKLFFVVRQLNGMFFSAIWPTVFSANKLNDRSFIKKMVDKGSRYISIIILPLSTLGFCVSYDFIRLWMGASYAENAIWAQLLFFVWFFAPMFGIFGNVLIGVGKIKLINYFGIVSTILNLAIGITATKTFGIGGVILGTVITYLVFMPIQFFVFMRALKVEWREILYPNLKIIASSVLLMMMFIGVIKTVHVSSMWELMFLSGTYLLITYGILFWKFLDPEEKNDLLVLAKIKVTS